MKRTLISTLVLILWSSAIFAQPENAPNQNPEQNYNRDGNWGNPVDGKWGSNTSWITADGEGQIYVLTRDAPYVRIHDRDGNLLRTWGGDPAITNPHSITIDDAGNAWISDSTGHAIFKFNSEGEWLMTLGKQGEPGDNSSTDRFNQPNHVFIHDNGDIYVSDGYVNSRIVHFTPEGDYIRMIGGVGGQRPGEFQAVHGIAVDNSGRLITNDSENFRVNVFDANGNFIESWPYVSRGGIEIVDDRIYISDVNQGEVNILTMDGELIETAYAPRAHGLAVDSDGSIYTSGASRQTVYKLTRKP